MEDDEEDTCHCFQDAGKVGEQQCDVQVCKAPRAVCELSQGYCVTNVNVDNKSSRLQAACLNCVCVR